MTLVQSRTLPRNHRLTIVTLALAILGSQLYVFQSGVPQPAHLVMALVLLFARKTVETVDGQLRTLALFCFYTCVVNSCFGLFYSDFRFLISSLHFVYGFIIFWGMKYLLMADINLSRRPVSQAVTFGLVGGLILMALLYAVGLGRYDFNPRYNGYFNDPNQMAYWVVCAFSVVAAMNSKRQWLLYSCLVLSTYLVIVTGSRAALLGLGTIWLGTVWTTIRKSQRRHSGLFALALVAVFGAAIYLGAVRSEQLDFAIERFVSVDVNQQISDRSLARVLDYPDYIIFGAGQGDDLRFNSTHEIHSTWAGLLFYYGLVGLGLFLAFVISVFRSVDFSHKLMMLGPLFYSAVTFGARTPVFWLFMAVFSVVGLQERRNDR